MNTITLILGCAAWFCIGITCRIRVERLRNRRRARSMSDLARKYAGTQG